MQELQNQKVAGIIMLNEHSGEKKFLVKKIKKGYTFITANVSEEKTGLACILQELKESVRVDVSAIGLVELTNTHVDKEKMPLFVFEMEGEEEVLSHSIKTDFVWETPATLREILAAFEIGGVPLFK